MHADIYEGVLAEKVLIIVIKNKIKDPESISDKLLRSVWLYDKLLSLKPLNLVNILLFNKFLCCGKTKY